jgi:hypothetical protein
LRVQATKNRGINRRIVGFAVVILIAGILVAVFLPAPYHFYLPKEGVCCLDGPPRSARIPLRIAISGGALLVALALTIYAVKRGSSRMDRHTGLPPARN